MRRKTPVLHPFMLQYFLSQHARFGVDHGYALLPGMEIAAYNFLLGLLPPEPLRWIPKSLLGSVVRPTLL